LLNAGSGNGGLLGPSRSRPFDQGAANASGVNDLLSGNPLVLMALGAGIAQGGIGRGLQGALAQMQAQQQEGRQQQARNATYAGLRAAGVPSGQALVGALNPEVLKTIAKFQFSANSALPPAAPAEQAPSAPTARGANAGAEIPQNLALENAISRLDRLVDGSKNNNDLPGLRNAAANHVANILRASGMTEDEIRRSADALKNSNNLDELKAAIGRNLEIMRPRSDSIAQAALLHRLSRTSQTTLQRLRNATSLSSQTPSGAGQIRDQ